MTDPLRILLNQITDEMPAEDFDPAKVVGDLKDKIDAIQWTIGYWDSEAARIDADYVKEFMKKRDSFRNKSLRLKEYVKFQMISHGFDKLPGKYKGYRIQNAAPILEIKNEANAELYLQHSDLIEQKTFYSWKKPEIKALLQSNAFEFPYAELKPNKSLVPFTVAGVEDDNATKNT